MAMSLNLRSKNMKEDLLSVLQNDGIAVLATDTIYGVVGKAQSKAVVERLYALKGRDEVKPFIILIPSLDALEHFGIVPNDKDREIIAQVWPGPVTVILPVAEDAIDRLEYLHRGTDALAFRMPAKQNLLELLRLTGPLVAPSANPQAMPTATTVAEARHYFGSDIDYYDDEGTVQGAPSTIVKIDNGKITLIRKGIASLDFLMKV
jgi:L-threonylcarbamoyladenylate synthase